MTNTTRTHDKDLYLHESRYDNPKEFFRTVTDRVRASGVAVPAVA